MCKFKDVIISEKGLVYTKNNLYLIISAYDYYCFQTNI